MGSEANGSPQPLDVPPVVSDSQNDLQQKRFQSVNFIQVYVFRNIGSTKKIYTGADIIASWMSSP